MVSSISHELPVNIVACAPGSLDPISDSVFTLHAFGNGGKNHGGPLCWATITAVDGGPIENEDGQTCRSLNMLSAMLYGKSSRNAWLFFKVRCEDGTVLPETLKDLKDRGLLRSTTDETEAAPSNSETNEEVVANALAARAGSGTSRKTMSTLGASAKQLHEQRKRLQRLQSHQRQRRRVAMKERVKSRIQHMSDDLFDGRRLSKAQRSAIVQRLMVEHKQELACVTYLARDEFEAERIPTQQRLYDADGDRYVICDVFQPMVSASQGCELQLDASREAPQGIPWEVKDCDSMNPTEHAHGQADYQRIFANSKKSGLWLFTKDTRDSNGRRNFAVLCEQVLPYCNERYSEIVLATRVAPYDCASVSKAAAHDAVIATWRPGRTPGVVFALGKEMAPAPPDNVPMSNAPHRELQDESLDFGSFGPVPLPFGDEGAFPLPYGM